MHDRQRRIARELGDAADIAGGDEVGPGQRDIGELALTQRRGQFRLQQIVGPGRPAAQMRFRHLGHFEARGRE